MTDAGATDAPVRILIAGVGNVLRCDDGFGVEVVRRLADERLPPGVRVVETGIAGIALVQELQEGWDALVVVDTVDLAKEPGTVVVIVPDVIDVHVLSWEERHDLMADMHMATPWRALMLARALGVLPERVLEVGCQPLDPQGPGQGLTEPVQAAVEVAVSETLRQVTALAANGVAS